MPLLMTGPLSEPVTEPLAGALSPLSGRFAPWPRDWAEQETLLERQHDRLEAFLEQDAGGYKELRDRPDLPGTSRLAPALHFGEISPRQILAAARSAQAGAVQVAWPTPSCLIRKDLRCR